MEQRFLTSTQKKIIEAVVKEPNLVHFYLTGGTALAAFYLHHRLSDDLDFFIFEEPDNIFLQGFVEKLKEFINAKEVRFERLYDRRQFFFSLGKEELKVEFTKYPFRQLEQPKVVKGIKVDSLRDIAANKLMAMLDRFDPKDFVDLFFILQQTQLNKVRRDAERKFGIKIDSLFLGGELAKAKRIAALPKMIRPLTVKELKDFFAERAKELAPDIFKQD